MRQSRDELVEAAQLVVQLHNIRADGIRLFLRDCKFYICITKLEVIIACIKNETFVVSAAWLIVTGNSIR